MNLEGQYYKLDNEQVKNLKHVALLATITKNYKLWRKYWAIKKEYLLLWNKKHNSNTPQLSSASRLAANSPQSCSSKELSSSVPNGEENTEKNSRNSTEKFSQ